MSKASANVGNTRDTRYEGRLLPCADVQIALLQRLAREPLALDRLVELTLIVRKTRIDQMIVAHLCLHVEAERALGLYVQAEVGYYHLIDAGLTYYQRQLDQSIEGQRLAREALQKRDLDIRAGE